MDRKLTPKEMKDFLSEVERGELTFSGLNAILEEKTEPTLHDVCIHELHGAVEALKQVVIQQGREIRELKEGLVEKK